MKPTQRDALLRKISALGKAGGMPLTVDPQKAIDELQRRCGVLQEAVTLLLDVAFQNPNTSSGGTIFRIDGRPTSAGYNLLTAAQANQEVGLNALGVSIYRHGLGYALDRFVVISKGLANPGAPQPTRITGERLYGYDNNRTVFQLDAEAVTQQAVVWVVCFSSKINPTNPGAQVTGPGVPTAPALTGVMRQDNTFVLAGSEGTTVP